MLSSPLIPASVGDGGDQGFDSIVGQENVEPSVPVTEPVEAEVPRPKRSKKKRLIYDSEGLPVASHPPKRLRADYGTAGGSVTGGKSLSVLNRLLQDSRLTVEQGVPALPTLPFITSSVTASPLEEGGDRTDSVTGPSLRTIGPSARFVVLSDSSHHSGAKPADPEVDSLVMTEAITVATVATTMAIPADISKDKSAPHPSVFGSSSSSEKTDRTLSLFTGRSGSGFDAGSIRAEEAVGAGSEEIYVPEWTVTKGFEMNDGRLCANMIDHFTPPAFFKTDAEWSMSNYLLSLMYQPHKRKWRSLAEEKNILLEAKDKEIEDLKSQLLKAKEESAEGTNSLLSIKVTGLSLLFDENDHELSVLGAFLHSLKSRTKSLVDQLLVVKCHNSNEYMEALGHAFGRAIEKGMQEGLAVRIEHGQAGRCLTDLEAYIPSAEDDFNSAIRDLRDLNFPLLQELSDKKDASTWDIMDILRLDDIVAETLDVFVSIEDPFSAEALIEPSVEVPATNVLSTMVIVPPPDPFVFVEDYNNPYPSDVVPENTTSGLE
ncbi:hypothetical protein Tco_0864334, partial [Tanacetum coccineum]